MLPKKLNLGCGLKCLKEYLNVDYIRRIYADQYHDLNCFPYPWSDNYFEEVLVIHVLEHLKDPVRFLEELYRIITNDAVIKIVVPYFTGIDVPSDITHQRGFCSYSFDLFQRDHPSHFYTGAVYKIIEKKIYFDRPFYILQFFVNHFNYCRVWYENYLAHIFCARSLHITLRAIK